MDGYDADIFVPSEFEIESFDIGDIHQRLYCSKAATTDYDLTGQIVWPASRVLAWYLYQTRHVISGKHVVEVGSGCGLAGFVAQQCGAASVTLTDGNANILNILNRTCSLNNLSEDDVRVRSLDWGNEEAVKDLIKEFRTSKKWPTVILGADVFQTSFGSPALLFKSIKNFFHAAAEDGISDQCVFYACFALRQTTKEDLIQQCAQDEGFLTQKLCIRDMLPQGLTPDDFTKEKLRLNVYTLR